MRLFMERIDMLNEDTTLNKSVTNEITNKEILDNIYSFSKSLNELQEKVNKNTEQLEYVLILQAKYIEELEKLKKNVDFIFSNSSQISTKVQSMNAKLNDNDLNIDKLDDQMQEMHTIISTLPNEFQQLNDMLANARFYSNRLPRNEGIINGTF